MLHVLTWFWGKKYSQEYVHRLVGGLRRHLKETHRFRIVTDVPEKFNDSIIIPDKELLNYKGCLARLRMFDPEWQALNDIRCGDRLVCLDLDVIVTAALDPLFYRPDTFLILRGANSSNPNPMNGSVMMLRAGSHPEVWREFSLERLSRIPAFEFPDDQGWIWHMLPKASGWACGPHSGIYAFKKPGWPKGDDLPKDARLVVFPGWRDPSKFLHLPWIQENWAA